MHPMRGPRAGGWWVPPMHARMQEGHQEGQANWKGGRVMKAVAPRKRQSPAAARAAQSTLTALTSRQPALLC